MRISARSARILQILAALVMVLVGTGSLLLLFFWQKAQAAPQQPVPFPHVSMVSAGVQCTFCHYGATKSRDAIIPSVERCMGCHDVIATTSPDIQKVAGYWQRQEPIPWARVYKLPRYVQFTHEVHIAKSIACETCHGDVGKMTVTEEAKNFTMGFCLDCHEKQSNAAQLKDCGVCHY